MTASTEPTGARDRIIAAAGRLFAELGYEGTSTRLIADAAGLNIATVAYHVGGKRDLYLEVMERAQRAERRALESAVEEFRAENDPAAGLRLLVDRYLDFCVGHPQVPALWMRRWLSDAPDLADLERRHVVPVFGMVADAVWAALRPADREPPREPGGAPRPEPDLEYVIWNIVWCVHGFCQGGVPDAEGRRRRGDDEEALRRVRGHLHLLVDRLLPARVRTP